MPDPILILKAVATALAVSAFAAAAGRRRPTTPLAAMIGVAAGLYALNATPRWPIREDQDRFLILVLPGMVLVEGLSIPSGASALLLRGVRLLAAMLVAPTLLFGSVYLADVAGPNSALWSPSTRIAIVLGLGSILFAVWRALDLTTERSGSAIRVPIALAATIAAASACVMLSGYTSGGMIGLPIAGAVVGATIVAAPCHSAPGDRTSGTGFAIVALFSLLLCGWAFGDLKLDAASSLFFTPLLCAIPEALPLRRSSPRVRTGVALGLVAVCVAMIVALTLRRFQDAAKPGIVAVGLDPRSNQPNDARIAPTPLGNL